MQHDIRKLVLNHSDDGAFGRRKTDKMGRCYQTTHGDLQAVEDNSGALEMA